MSKLPNISKTLVVSLTQPATFSTDEERYDLGGKVTFLQRMGYILTGTMEMDLEYFTIASYKEYLSNINSCLDKLKDKGYNELVQNLIEKVKYSNWKDQKTLFYETYGQFISLKAEM